ncbi:AAA family ATPase [Clostridium sp.]|jgi:cytidylate kinase|uniref:cytidylate kinase-like family protein n=1 Tax=Clostridium sp. TaxID=1506 RepID=UPI003EEB1C5D
MKRYCVTINLQFGSLGRVIAKELSGILGIEYHDKYIVEAASKKLNMPISTISMIEESSIKSSFSNVMSPLGNISTAKQHKLFDVQRRIILDLAEKKSCIIVGRCSDFILKDYKECLNIFIYAPSKARYKNCVDTMNMKPLEAERMIAKVDKARDSYYRCYAGYSNESIKHRHIMIDSSLLGVHGTAQVLADMIKKRFETS